MGQTMATPKHISTVVAEVMSQLPDCSTCTSAIGLIARGATMVRCPSGAIRQAGSCPLIQEQMEEGRRRPATEQPASRRYRPGSRRTFDLHGRASQPGRMGDQDASASDRRNGDGSQEDEDGEPCSIDHRGRRVPGAAAGYKPRVRGADSDDDSCAGCCAIAACGSRGPP
jgi:hypothetical protein